MRYHKISRCIIFIVIGLSFAWMGCDNDKNTLQPIQTSSPDEEYPHVVITEPDSGAMVPEGDYCHVVASAWDNIGVVRAALFVDDVKWDEDVNYPFEFDFHVSEQNPDHMYTIYVRVYDAAGNPGNSPKITVTSYNSGG